MQLRSLFPNNLAKERAAAGMSQAELAAASGVGLELFQHFEEGRLLPSHLEFDRITDALGGLDPTRIYAYSVLNTIGDKRFIEDRPDYAGFFDSMSETSHLLVSPDELTWLDRELTPDHQVDVFVNMSCATQQVPHLILDTTSVLKALGVSFKAGAGRVYCCGTYYRRNANHAAAARMHDAVVRRNVEWGASTVVHMCTQCVNTFTEVAHRRFVETGEAPVENVQLLRFIDERLEELGERVPWKKEVHAKVMSHGHANWSLIHDIAKRDVGAVARRIPGVEFVGPLDRTSVDSFCDTEPGSPLRPTPRNRNEVAAYRAELAEVARSWGADTISPSHQTCYLRWSPFASGEVAITHVLSLLAEALGVQHPNRHAEAMRLGSPEAVVAQNRAIWTAWGMTESKALDVASKAFNQAFGTVDLCACGRGAQGNCGHAQELIPVDILNSVAGPH
jgi:Fe-S oxidoreductase